MKRWKKLVEKWEKFIEEAAKDNEKIWKGRKPSCCNKDKS